jgi:dephospho-CoA kinase
VPALTVGLTGGIGAGKSLVLAEFVARGAIGIDADDVARDVVVPGSPGLDRVVAAFGPDVAAPDGSLDQTRLAAIVFADADARARLEAILHPLVRAETRRRIEAAAPGAIVVNAVPLLVETGLVAEFDAIVVVFAPLEVRLQRLMADRSMSRADAMARVASQATDDERARVATWTVVNDGSREQLRQRAEAAWAEIQGQALRAGRR